MKKIFCAAIILVFAVNLFAQEMNKEIVKLQKKFETINNFTADFSQKTAGENNKSGFSLKGKFLFQKKNNFRIEFARQTIISDGETIWNYNKGMKRVVISSFENEPSAFSINAFIMEYPAKCKIKSLDSKTIKMVPFTDDVEFNSVLIKYDKNYVIEYIEVEDFSETKYIVSLYNVKLNKKLSKEKFTFTPPEGIQVVDLR